MRSSAPRLTGPRRPTSSGRSSTSSSSTRCSARGSTSRSRRRWSSRRPTSRSGSCATSSPSTSSGRSSTTRSSFVASTSFFTRTAPELVDRVELDEDAKPSLFERYGIDKAIQSTINRRVDLPSGGYLIIDYAEAMTVIDINSGSFVGRGKGARLEDTITKTNLEAAEEAVHQLRLRDIGGIIVIDFIDMARARNRDAVLKTLRTELDKDRTKTYVVEISPLGLVEMTRQNVTEGVREILTKPCPDLPRRRRRPLRGDRGAIEVERKLRDLAAERPDPEAFLIQVHPARRGAPAGRTRPAAAGARGGGGQALPLRGKRRPADRPLRGASPRVGARRSRSVRCRSARARRSTWRSRSRTCTTRTRPSASSTAT